MKLREILFETDQTDHRRWRAESMREAFDIPENTNWITAYHGTSEKNANNIIKTKLRSGAFAAIDYDTAAKYSQIQAHGGKPYVMQLRLYIGSCLPTSGYITTQEDLVSTSNGFVPKDLLRKVYEIM